MDRPWVGCGRGSLGAGLAGLPQAAQQLDGRQHRAGQAVYPSKATSPGRLAALRDVRYRTAEVILGVGLALHGILAARMTRPT